MIDTGKHFNPHRKESHMKLVRILALLTVLFLAGLYIAAIVAALSSSPAAGDWFKACICLSVILPILLYGMALVGKSRSQHQPDDEDNEETGEDSTLK